jgi:glycosyltransferase involved in cell wall biosynthesis
MFATKQAIPRLSIGVPVYNGAKYIRATLDSILAQTWGDFEVVICDNASNDDTPAICEEYARRDGRIRFHRNERNLGPAANYTRTFELSRGELFKWQAADDVLEPDFLKKCVQALDEDPDAVCAYTRSKAIDSNGNVTHAYDTELDLSHPHPAVRFWRMVMVDHKVHHAAELWGVMRSHPLRQWTPLKGAFPSADRVVMSRIVLTGKFKRIDEHLFLDRVHAERSEKAFDKSKIRQGSVLARHIGCGPTPPYQWWDSSKVGKIVFPEWKWLAEHARSVEVVDLYPFERVACAGVVACLAVKFLPRLLRDLLIAAELCLYRLFPARASNDASKSGSTSATGLKREGHVAS